MLQSPLTGTAIVVATLGLFAIPLHHLTSRPPPTPPPAATAPVATGTPALLRLKLLAPARSIHLKSQDGATLLELADMPAGESEHDAAVALQTGHLDLLLEADLGDSSADTAIFLTVIPDFLDPQTRYLIGTGTLAEPLHYKWPTE